MRSCLKHIKKTTNSRTLLLADVTFVFKMIVYKHRNYCIWFIKPYIATLFSNWYVFPVTPSLRMEMICICAHNIHSDFMLILLPIFSWSLLEYVQSEDAHWPHNSHYYDYCLLPFNIGLFFLANRSLFCILLISRRLIYGQLRLRTTRITIKIAENAAEVANWTTGTHTRTCAYVRIHWSRKLCDYKFILHAHRHRHTHGQWVISLLLA